MHNHKNTKQPLKLENNNKKRIIHHYQLSNNNNQRCKGIYQTVVLCGSVCDINFSERGVGELYSKQVCVLSRHQSTLSLRNQVNLS